MVNLGADIDGIEFEEGDEIRDAAGETLFEFVADNSPFATEEFVDDGIDSALEGYATEEYVDDAIEEIDVEADLNLEQVNVAEHGFEGDVEDGDVLEFIADNGPAKYVFPEGEYGFATELDFTGELEWSSFAIEGLGDGFEFHPTTEDVDLLARTNDANSPLDRFTLSNFTVVNDLDNEYDVGIARMSANKGFEISDVSFENKRMYHSLHDDEGGPGTDGEIYNLRTNILDTDGTGVIRNVRMPDGGEGNDRPRVIPFSVEAENEGTIIYDRCQLAGFQGNGFYWKDGDGKAIAIGCVAENVGGQMFRLGNHDISIGGRTVTDERVEDMDHEPGVHIDIHRARGTSILGHRALQEVGGDHVIRLRDGNESCSVRDVWIDNYSTQYAIRATSNADGDDEVETHGEGKAVFENIHINQFGTDHSSIRASQVQLRRSNAVLRDSTIKTEYDWHFAVEVAEGDAVVENCRFEVEESAFDVRIGNSDYGDLGNVHFDKCDMSGSVELDEINECTVLEFEGCTTDADDLFENDEPVDVDEIDSFSVVRCPEYSTWIDSQKYSPMEYVIGDSAEAESEPYIRLIFE